MSLKFISIFVAAWLALAVTNSPARADPFTVAVLSFIGITGLSAATVSAITFIGTLALSVGASYLKLALTSKPSRPDISSLPGGTTGKMQIGGIMSRSFVVGRAMDAGRLVYPNTYGSAAALDAAVALGEVTAAAGNTPNDHLVFVISLCDLPVTGLVGMYVDGRPVTYNPAATPALEGIPIPEYNVGGKDHLWVRFYDGTQVAADALLVQLFGSDPDYPYESNRIGVGIAYAVVTALVNRELFPNFPQYKFVLDGIKLYDRRYDSSAGGAGSQRWSTSDSSTFQWTENNAVIIENILRGIYYDGKWVYGAQTVAPAQLPSASWVAAQSECDSAIDLAAGGTEPQYKAGGIIRFDVEPVSTIHELQKACNGKLAEIGGVYKLRVGAPGLAVFSFTDGDVLSTDQQTFDPFPSLGQTVNAVNAKYISPAEGWTPKDAPPLYDAALEAADGGRLQAADVNYSFVTSGTQVQRLMRSERDDHRAMRQHILPLSSDVIWLEPNMVLSWTSMHNGYSSKLFEIVEAQDQPNVNMGLVIKEIDPNAYDWVAATDEQPITDGTIVIQRPTSQTIVGWDVQPWTILSDSLQGQPGIKLIWDASALDVDGVLFQIRLVSSGEVVFSGTAEDFAAGFKIVGENLLFNTAYQARGQYRPISVRDVTWSGWTNVTTPNVRTAVVALDDALNNQITTQRAAIDSLLSETQDLIASLSADREAANWLDRASTRTAISASFGTSYAAIVDESAVRAGETSALAVRATSLETSVNDPSTGLATRASASDVTALESLTGDATHGNLALATRALSVEANINGPSSSAAVTITIASPAVVSWTGHGLVAGRIIKFTTTGALPAGITAGTTYYVIPAGLGANSFEISTTFGGSAVNTSGSQSGTHTAIASDVASGLSAVSADGMFRAVASAGSGGALAIITLQVRASIGATFAEAGIELASFVDPSNNPYSRLRLKADRTEVLIPGITGGDPFAPFAIQNVNAVPQIALVPTALPDGGVGQRALESGVTSGNISNRISSDVTRTVTQWNNGGAGEVVISSSVVVGEGSAMWIDFNTVFTTSPTSNNGVHGWIKIDVNGTTIKQFNYDMYSAAGYYDAFNGRFFANGLTAGDAVVTVTMRRNLNDNSDLTAIAPQLILTELPKPNVVSGVATAPTPSVSYQTSIYGGTSGSFPATAIGSADANRIVVAAIGWQAINNYYPTLTIGGQAATLINGERLGINWLYLFAARVPSGTTADIVVANIDPAATHKVLTVWKVVALNATPYSHASARSGGDMNLGTLSPSIIVAAAYGDGAITGFSAIWSGGTGTPTERVDTTGGSGAVRYAGYDMAASVAEYKNFYLTGSGGTDYVAVANVFK